MEPSYTYSETYPENKEFSPGELLPYFSTYPYILPTLYKKLNSKITMEISLFTTKNMTGKTMNWPKKLYSDLLDSP